MSSTRKKIRPPSASSTSARKLEAGDTKKGEDEDPEEMLVFQVRLPRKLLRRIRKCAAVEMTTASAYARRVLNTHIPFGD